MDRRRALAALFIAAASLGASAPGELPLREARWIAPEARFAQLSTYQPPCFKAGSSDAIIGWVAFQDPLLLGGQAARAGLSCASCHRGGRGNPSFVFQGVSGAPGTADVTASLLSSHRGDGVFNPKLIPDLTSDPPKISSTAPGALEAFIRGLIVEEFDGAEPPKRVLDGLAAFVRELDPALCRNPTALRIEHDIESYDLAINSAGAALMEEDRATAAAMIRAARSRLGVIAERYPASTTKPLTEASAVLFEMQNLLRVPSGDAADGGRWMMTPEWEKPLVRAQSRSLYNPKRLAKALNAARTP